MSEDLDHFFSEEFEPPFTLSLPQQCQQTNLDPEERPQFCWFDCLGEVDSNRIDIQENGYFKANEVVSLSLDSEDISQTNKHGTVLLFDKTWDKGMSCYKHLDLFFKMISKEIMIIEHGASVGVSVLGNNISWNSNSHQKFKDSRIHCIDFLQFLQKTVKILCSDKRYAWLLKELFPILKKHLRGLRRHLRHLIDLPEFVHAHPANSNGNKSLQASYHLFHLHLDIRWNHIILLKLLSSSKFKLSHYCKNISSVSDEFFGDDSITNEIQSIILELLELSLKRFEKVDVSYLQNKSPFSCTCVQEFWALVIRLSAQLHSCNKGRVFWDLLNTYLDMGMHQAPEISETMKFFRLSSTKFSIFSLWALCNIARLHNYALKDTSCNYPLLDSNLKVLLNGDISEVNLRIIMLFVERICLEIWEPKPETILILWEYFHKKINSNFYVPGAPPSSLAVVSKSPKALIKQLNSYLEDVNNVDDSFQHFLRIIGLHLRKSRSIPRHWNLLKGRLYSKLTLAKLETLSRVGEYHFISLFLILAITQDLKQIESKMVDLIKSYFNKRKYLSEELIKGQLGLVLLLLENEKDSSAALQPISDYFQSIDISDNIDLFRLYVETFQDILSLNIPLNFGQHLLIDKWMSVYLSTSSGTDTTRLLDTIVSLLSRLKMYCNFDSPDQDIIVMIEKLWDQLKSYLEFAGCQQETPYQVCEIAASLCSISLQVQNKERFCEIVNLFAFRSVIDISILRQFVCTVSQNEGVSDIMPCFGMLVLKTWIKCCFLCSDFEHTEMKELTKTTFGLPEMSNLLGHTVLSLNLDYSSKPFLDFITCLHTKYATEDIWKKQTLRDKVSIYFDGLEKWIHPIIANPRDNGKIMSLYKTVGQMVCLISPLIYCKSKPNTVLQKMIDLLLLPMSMRNPEAKIHPHILAAVKESLHLFVEGLIYLDPESDHYISRILKELILIYIPHCMNNQNLFASNKFLLITSFANYDDSSRCLMLDQISSLFFKKKARNPHPYANLALKFIKELVINHKSNEDVLLSLVKSTLERICDIIMYSEEKTIVNTSAKEILRLIFNSEILRASSKAVDGIMGIFLLLCHENLAWSSRQLFDLFISIISVAPDLIRRFTPTLLEQIKQVEAKRGVGYDRTLRLGIERIEINLRAIKEVS